MNTQANNFFLSTTARPLRTRSRLGDSGHTRALFLLLLVSAQANAQTLRVQVQDADGAPIAGAAVYAKPAHSLPKTKPKTVVIDQIDKEFVNHITVLQTGTPVLFPNHDSIRHHVYSFSDAKKFELPLYQGTPSQPVVFDTAGAVTLGCNIHDWMSAYVYVVDSPFFTLTDPQGSAQLDLPDGQDYSIAAWHPQLKKAGPEPQAINIPRPDAVVLTLHLKKSFRTPRLPALAANAGYR